SNMACASRSIILPRAQHKSGHSTSCSSSWMSSGPCLTPCIWPTLPICRPISPWRRRQAMATLPEDACLCLSRGYRMQWEPAQDCHVLLYPEGMVKLNASAYEILSRCNGNKTVATIVNELQQAFPKAELEDHVWQFLRRAEAQGWIKMAQP